MLVIDGNSILNRQYFGVRPLTTKSGIFTNAVYGFLNVLLTQLEKLKPDYAAVAFDVHAPTFRHKMFAGYKAGRKPTPPELLMQFPYTKDIIRALGIRVIEKEGYEADDTLGTLARLAEESGDTDCCILTGDRDSLQLISKSCKVLLAGNTEVTEYGEAAFFEKYGVRPDQFVDVKALMGDSSDNIPGVRGVGEKTALKLISTCGTLERVYEDIDGVKVGAKILESLKEDKEVAFLSRDLARINRNAPIGVSSLSDLAPGERDDNKLISLFAELEFSSFASRLGLTEKSESSSLPEPVRLSPGELESAGLAFPAALVCEENSVGLCDGKKYISCDFGDISEVLPFLSSHEFIVCDCKKLMHRLAERGAGGFACSFDVMLAAYVISPTDGSYDLPRLTQAYLKDMGKSAFHLYRLAGELHRRLKQDGLEKLYYDIEQPLAGVLFKMERVGFEVDKRKLAGFSDMLSERIDRDLESIYSIAGHTFNVNSTKQLAAVLFEEQKLPVIKKTKSGYSTDAEVLEKLRPYAPIVELILDYRQLAKLKSTYADGLYAVADENSRIHSSFNQTVTATGRLSSTEPNLQNIPIRTELGHEMRKCFVAPVGKVLVDADYSQIELRLLAHISADPIMIEAFVNGEDIHASTASQVFGVPQSEVTPELRKRAKAINFGIVYGMGGFSLANDIGVSKKEADAYIAGYKSKYKGVSEYLSAIIESAYRTGFVTTMFGRRRYIPELTSSKASMRNFGERVAMNSPIQGSAADIIKIAMINVDRALSESGLDARLVLQVHDELILECAEKDAPSAAKLLKREMENAVRLLVPLSVEVSCGKTWYECK